MQQSLKLGGTNYHFRQVKVPGFPLLTERPVYHLYLFINYPNVYFEQE